jgi:hypothetical protein
MHAHWLNMCKARTAGKVLEGAMLACQQRPLAQVGTEPLDVLKLRGRQREGDERRSRDRLATRRTDG